MIMSKDLIHDVGHKSVGQWVRLKGKTREGTVSYTHLTLPTICSV